MLRQFARRTRNQSTATPAAGQIDESVSPAGTARRAKNPAAPQATRNRPACSNRFPHQLLRPTSRIRPSTAVPYESRDETSAQDRRHAPDGLGLVAREVLVM